MRSKTIENWWKRVNVMTRQTLPAYISQITTRGCTHFSIFVHYFSALVFSFCVQILAVIIIIIIIIDLSSDVCQCFIRLSFLSAAMMLVKLDTERHSSSIIRRGS